MKATTCSIMKKTKFNKNNINIINRERSLRLHFVDMRTLSVISLENLKNSVVEQKFPVNSEREIEVIEFRVRNLVNFDDVGQLLLESSDVFDCGQPVVLTVVQSYRNVYFGQVVVGRRYGPVNL